MIDLPKREESQVRRTLTALITTVMLVLVATPATGHGLCAAIATKPLRSGTSVIFKGQLDCVEVHAFYAEVTVKAWRRIPGGSWVQFATKYSGNRAPTRDITLSLTTAFDCNKDYKTGVFVVAQNTAGGSGHSGTATSTVLSHTC